MGVQAERRWSEGRGSGVLAVVAGAALLVAGACGAGPVTATGELVPTTDTRRPPVERTTTSSTERVIRVYDPSFDVPVPPDTTTTAAAAAAPAGEREGSGGRAEAPRPSGGGGAPVTTIGGGGGADPSGTYRGYVGTLDIDEVVTAPAASAPATALGTHPLTGLPGHAASHPAAVVKIDNSPAARPQAGLDVADLVVEEEVEGGLTRFAAVFHSTGAIVGPVRSGRTTDIGVVNGLGSPLLLYSGANAVTDTLLLRQPHVQNRSASRSSGYWRQRGRRAPSNLFSDTGPHWASASGGPPPAQFAYRAPGEPAAGTPDGDLGVVYRANTASWSWDGTAWLRSQGGRAHVAASGNRISAANVVVVETRKVDTGMVDSSGATVPEFVFVGSGRATVFTGGNRIEGTWTRPTLGSVATLTTGDGSVIALTPGRTWIEVVEAGAGQLR